MKQIYRLYGIPRRIKRTPFLFVFSFLLLLTAASYAQAPVNAYARVTGIATSNGRTTLTIANRNQANHTFAAGEQVIVMQMQANVIGGNTGNNANFGNLSAIGNAGFYDVATIYSLTATSITLTDVLANKFTIAANNNVQVISFQKLSTGNFTTTAGITAVPWDRTTGTGGVIALQVPGTFTINHSITADAQGFVGGGASGNFQDGCGPSVYISSSTNYGAKGEGLYFVNTASNPTFVRGRGKIISGGGGGSAGNAGGGGGSNYSAGGTGGPGWSCSGGNASGGLGGIDLSNYLMTGTRLFMGGGGGGGQGNNSEQTAGANGGGIIIIQAGVITTGCATSVSISANGNNSNNTTGSGADGAGGAGAGGTILLHAGSFAVPSNCRLNVQANGGNGGNVTHADAHGGGAGGGQGAVIYSGAMPTTNITTTTNPGTGGRNSSANNATSAGGGAGTPNAGIISGVGSVLATKLIGFTAERNNKTIVLNWTASEEANTVYTVQRATDGINFAGIGTVNGTGNGSTANSYSFTDANPAAGKNYYQLKINSDVPGQTSYSAIVSVNTFGPQSLPVAYPNPAHDHFIIRVNDDYSNKTHQVIITDLTGKIMYTNSYKPVNGSITVTPATQLKPGLYIFKLTSEGYEQAGKLMIR